eukprot:gene1011-3844_t
MPSGIDADKKDPHRSYSDGRTDRHRDGDKESRSRESGRGARDYDRRENLDRREREDRSGGSGSGRVDSMRGQPDSLPPLARPQKRSEHQHHRSGSSAPAESPLVAELQKLGQNLARRAGSETAPDDAGAGSSDAEQGEIQQTSDEEYPDHEDSQNPHKEGGSEGMREGRKEHSESRKRKHAPIVWQSPAVKAGRSTQSILDRAMEEAELFKQMQADDMGIDPDAPAAMKSSPSFSGEESVNSESEDEAGPTGTAPTANPDADVADESPKAKTGLASRWLDAGDDAEAKPGSMPPPSGYIAPVMSGLGPGEGGGFDSDSDDDLAYPDEHNAPESARSLINRTYDMMSDCRSVDEFEKISRISEGTYGVVYKAREKKTGRLVALKRIKMEKERDGFPITSIREINILLNFNHKNIVNVNEVVMVPRTPTISSWSWSSWTMMVVMGAHEPKTMTGNSSFSFLITEPPHLRNPLSGMAPRTSTMTGILLISSYTDPPHFVPPPQVVMAPKNLDHDWNSLISSYHRAPHILVPPPQVVMAPKNLDHDWNSLSSADPPPTPTSGPTP